MKFISASEANRRFSHLLRQAAQGEIIAVVSRGKTVATVGPASNEMAQRQAARQSLLARLRAQGMTGERNWRREELYEG